MDRDEAKVVIDKYVEIVRHNVEAAELTPDPTDIETLHALEVASDALSDLGPSESRPRKKRKYSFRPKRSKV